MSWIGKKGVVLQSLFFLMISFFVAKIQLLPCSDEDKGFP
jgi:hypothetical protein